MLDVGIAAGYAIGGAAALTGALLWHFLGGVRRPARRVNVALGPGSIFLEWEGEL